MGGYFMNLQALSGELIPVLTFRPGGRAYGGNFILQNVTDQSFDLNPPPPERLSRTSFFIQSEKGNLNYDTLSGPLHVLVSEEKDKWRAYLYLECNIMIFIPL